MDRGAVYGALVTGVILGLFAVSFLQRSALEVDSTNDLFSQVSTATSSTDAFPGTVLISLHNPKAYSEITSPLFVTGEARGVWFNNGEFTVTVYDADRMQIAEASATALVPINNSDDFVPFVALLNFTSKHPRSNGFIMVKRGGASALNPSPWDYREIPIYFAR